VIVYFARGQGRQTMTRKKKKPNKQQREKKRAEMADFYEQAFKHGYAMGYHQGEQDTIEKANREVRKISTSQHYGGK
jgi:flagellar biosynthesis/type III secretory pathway protein FliH